MKKAGIAMSERLDLRVSTKTKEKLNREGGKRGWSEAQVVRFILDLFFKRGKK